MPKSILLVEDNQYERELLSELLTTQSRVNVISVSRGRHALDLLLGNAVSKVSPDEISVVLLDLSLPDVPGIEVLRELRSAAAARCIPVVIVSRSQHDIDIWASYRMGAYAYLVKPDSTETLIALITRTVTFWTEVNVRIPPGRAALAA